MKKYLLHKMLLTCKEATFLVEKREAGKISFREKIQLKAHLWICNACKNYEKQSKIIEKMLNKIFQKKEAETLSKEFKQKIIEKMKS